MMSYLCMVFVFCILSLIYTGFCIRHTKEKKINFVLFKTLKILILAQVTSYAPESLMGHYLD